MRALMGLSAFGLCMMLSFTLVRQWTHALPPASGVSTTAAQAAPILRGAANGLAALGNDVFPRLPAENPASAEDAAWVARVAPERAELILQELARAPQELDEVKLCTLAATRMQRLAAEPSNKTLREQALHQVRLAIEVAGGYISRHKAEGHCREAAQPVRF